MIIGSTGIRPLGITLAQERCLPQHGVRGLLRAYPMSVLAMHLSGQFTFRSECGPCTIHATGAPHVGRTGREDGHGSRFRK